MDGGGCYFSGKSGSNILFTGYFAVGLCRNRAEDWSAIYYHHSMVCILHVCWWGNWGQPLFKRQPKAQLTRHQLGRQWCSEAVNRVHWEGAWKCTNWPKHKCVVLTIISMTVAVWVLYSVVGQILVAKEPDLLYYCESFECTLNALVVVSGDLVQVRGQHYNVLCMSYESCQL